MTLRPGCPIRISTDQSLLAAPRGFSQRATSFIASWRQGIHQMPFSRLSFLALEPAATVPLPAIANRSRTENPTKTSHHAHRPSPRLHGGQGGDAPNASEDDRNSIAPITGTTPCNRLTLSLRLSKNDTEPGFSCQTPQDQPTPPRNSTPVNRSCVPLPPPTSATQTWWRRTGSNRRPTACKAVALPTELRPQGSCQA
jgi:hypothetical protein